MQKIDRKIFWETLDRSVFGGSVPQSAVDQIERVFAEYEARGWDNLGHLAYMLATMRREVGPKMLPVRECFAQSDAAARACRQVSSRAYSQVIGGNVYYGRGLVQLTWLDNYEKMGEHLGIALVQRPDMALDPEIAIKIMFEGMQRGQFAGDKKGRHTLARHIPNKNPTQANFISARRIINGTDHAQEIAGYAEKFFAALKAAEIKDGIKAEVGTGTAGGAVVVEGTRKAVEAGLPTWEIVLIIVGLTVLTVGAIYLVRKVKSWNR
jgi:putative chitinase